MTMLEAYNLSDLKIDQYTVTVQVEGVGTVLVDFSEVPDFFKDYPHLKDPKAFAKADLKDGALWFPPDIHIEPDYLLEVATDKVKSTASFSGAVKAKYNVVPE